MNTKPIIFSKLFLISLILLLLNDFILKHSFPNFVTGILSDFVGLIVFVIFWTWIFPKFRTSIYIFTMVFFIWWKSSFSQGFIDLWNNYSIFQIQRTIDYSDLISLLILPIIYLYQIKYDKITICYKSRFKNIGLLIVSIIAVFSFVATSYLKTINYNENQEKDYIYEIKAKPDIIIKIINESVIKNEKYYIKYNNSNNIIYEVPIKFKYLEKYDEYIYASFDLSFEKEITELKLISITSHFPPEDYENEDVILKELFEKNCINIILENLHKYQ